MMKNILDIAKDLLGENYEYFTTPYGWDKAKLDYDGLMQMPDVYAPENQKLVLVTAITPTKAGEGKTTMSIALHDGLRSMNVESMLALREPSLGPVFGMKGGATGGGLASVIPSEEINLHFTGDMHALTSSINLIAACIDNHIFQGNELNINPNKIVWKRALDMNDRALRKVTVGQSMKKETPRTEEFVITVASELMAIMCLAQTEDDFKTRVGNIIVAYDNNDKPIYVKDLKIVNAVMKLMKNALNPNLVQTLEGNPVLIHGGPFANIAHGCNSIRATKLAKHLGEVTITEAGFGADLGAEKFLDIVCPSANLKPDCVVMVATVKAIKMHGGQEYEDLATENLEAVRAGVVNLERHVDNMRQYGIPVVVCINRFPTDTDHEIKIIKNFCENILCVPVAVCTSVAEGSKGGKELADKVYYTLYNNVSNYKSILDDPLITESEYKPYRKVYRICEDIYGASKAVFTPEAEAQLDKYISMGYGDAYICMAKTPMSFTDDPKILGAPEDFTITIREVRLSAGANFLVCLTGDIMTMPGLPKVPAAVKMEDVADAK